MDAKKAASVLYQILKSAPMGHIFYGNQYVSHAGDGVYGRRSGPGDWGGGGVYQRGPEEEPETIGNFAVRSSSLTEFTENISDEDTVVEGAKGVKNLGEYKKKLSEYATTAHEKILASKDPKVQADPTGAAEYVITVLYKKDFGGVKDVGFMGGDNKDRQKAIRYVSPKKIIPDVARVVGNSARTGYRPGK